MMDTRFEPPRATEERRETERVAALLIKQFGVEAGCRVGCLARVAGALEESTRLLALADEIERRQGFGWWFGEEEKEGSGAGS